MPDPLLFEIRQRCSNSRARVGRIETPHGGFDTPAFMPVGTRASVKGLTPDQVVSTGSQIILNNAYHLMLRPGSALIARRGGVHRFMCWDGPILTDSGGYQAFSMSDINTVDDEGVTFKSIIDGSRVHLGPVSSMRVQNELGADIIMAFDDCPPAVDPRSGKVDASGDDESHRRRLEIANDRTARWLEACVRAHNRRDEQALFGIVQGGTDEELRRISVEQVCSIDLPGYAIGGVAVGEGPEEIRRVIAFTAPLLPEEKPRYVMGIGYERDLVSAVRSGCDMFDCVLPTRNGRNATAFTRSGRIQLRNVRFSEDDGPIDAQCSCPVCQPGERACFSRAYLRHLFLAGEMLGPILLSMHNICHFQQLMVDIRRAVVENDWSVLRTNWPVLDHGHTVGHPA